jgi:hypothetical protein
MEMQNVQSSMIAAVGHDSSTNTLTVRFKNGREYQYPCTPAEFQELLSAPSIGKHFNERHKGRER